jgi:hypothetical protein
MKANMEVDNLTHEDLHQFIYDVLKEHSERIRSLEIKLKTKCNNK